MGHFTEEECSSINPSVCAGARGVLYLQTMALIHPPELPGCCRTGMLYRPCSRLRNRLLRGLVDPKSDYYSVWSGTDDSCYIKISYSETTRTCGGGGQPVLCYEQCFTRKLQR